MQLDIVHQEMIFVDYVSEDSEDFLGLAFSKTRLVRTRYSQCESGNVRGS
jgi:hypothetical protein